MMSCSTGAIVVVEQRGELAVEELDGIFCTGEVAFDVGTEWVEDNQVATVTEVQNSSYGPDSLLAELTAQSFDPEIGADQNPLGFG